MEKLNFPRVGETMFHRVLDNGLNVFVSPKPGFQKSYAFFATRYGGMDTRFRLEGEWIDSPAGVAHFLEHKMFDTQEGNALQDLAENGASPNAFTSNAITGYYFESTEKFEENLRTLLSFVCVPWFTQESVDKEQGIIGQEIGMVNDDPNWRVYLNLMEALYVRHAARTSVIGTVESISRITAETLYDCHRAFYAPSNMVLCVAGDVEPEQICRIAEEILPQEPGQTARRDYGEQEPVQAAQNLISLEMEVSAPQFLLGFKGDPEPEGGATLSRRVLGELAAEALLGTSSPLYGELYRQGLINASFQYGYESYPGCAFLMAGGESRDPQAVRDAIWREAQRISREGIDPALWSRVKKGSYGNRLQGLNSFENLCIGQAQCFFRGCRFLDFPEAFDRADGEEARALIAAWCAPERTALSLALPVGGGQT